MSANYNRFTALGRLTADPELKFLPSGTAVCNLRMATNRKFKDKAGQWQEEGSFFTVVAWGKTAESCGEFLHKGSSILVEGRLQSRSWETPDGQKRTILEVQADGCQFLDGKPKPETEIEF